MSYEKGFLDGYIQGQLHSLLWLKRELSHFKDSFLKELLYILEENVDA